MQDLGLIAQEDGYFKEKSPEGWSLTGDHTVCCFQTSFRIFARGLGVSMLLSRLELMTVFHI